MASKAISAHWPAIALLAMVWGQGVLHSQPKNGAAGLKTGREIFRAGCAGCHGTDGQGQEKATIGFEAPKTFPDFTDCNATAREPDLLWRAVIHHGGPGRGFSEIMPSFAEALTPEQIKAVSEYLRSFCKEPGWPRGELNLPRALITEKAFPEDEVLWETSFDAEGGPAASSKLIYERRFGRANQIELNLPFGYRTADSGTRFGGIGDVKVGYKRMIASSLRTGSIFSLSGEAVLPTGNKSTGLGKGTAVVEGFAAYGQLLPKNAFLQFQTGYEVPTKSEMAKALFWRTAVGRYHAGDRGFGRLWSPMVEVLADREFESGAKVNWDLVPQFQVTLNQRQHIRANFGVRIPVNNTAPRPVQVIFYLLWDWFDGGWRDGWRGVR